MREIVALVEDVRGAFDDHASATDAFDCFFDGTVYYRQFPDESLIAVLTFENLPVDT